MANANAYAKPAPCWVDHKPETDTRLAALQDLFTAAEEIVDTLHRDRELRREYASLIDGAEVALRRAYAELLK
jgi:hypothetical protein